MLVFNGDSNLRPPPSIHLKTNLISPTTFIASLLNLPYLVLSFLRMIIYYFFPFTLKQEMKRHC